MTIIPPVAITGRQIGEGHPCFIVAEIGTNHEGDLATALEMIREAKLCGADAVKFQSFLADELVPRKHPDYDYLKQTEIPQDWYQRLLAEGQKQGVIVFSTASNETTLGWMEALDFPCYKIASGNLTHLPLIERAASAGKPLIMSTGYADMAEIGEAVQTARSAGNGDIVLLHCVGNYPAFPQEVNLRTMESLRVEFDVPVGYSDHTQGTTACQVAAAMGASLIEKHFSSNPRGLEGDHRISADPMSFAMMRAFVREAEMMHGAPGKVILDRERKQRAAARRVLYAARDILAGEIIKKTMVLYLRPGGKLESMTGKPYDLPPNAIRWVVGRRALRYIPAQAPIHWQDMEILDAGP